MVALMVIYECEHLWEHICLKESHMVKQQSIGATWLCCGCLYGARAGVQSSTVGQHL